MKRFLLSRIVDLTKHTGLWQQVLRDRGLLDFVRGRTFLTGICFILCFTLIAIRLVDVMVLHGLSSDNEIVPTQEKSSGRADILDRNGVVLATHLVTGSVYANPTQILNPEEAAEKLVTVFPELNYETLRDRLASAAKSKFVWISRHISPKNQQAVNQLGIPGVYILQDSRRMYPHGQLFSHVLGYSGIDGDGLAGVERYFDPELKEGSKPLVLSLDIRVQHIVRDELVKAVEKFSAKGANAMVMDISTGEVLSMVSFPEYNPNLPNEGPPEAAFNKNTLAVNEPGSTFKILNTAIALETGHATLTSVWDASHPLRVGRFTITDFKGKNRPLNVQEAFLYSSNIVNAKMALHFGSVLQRKFLEIFGMFDAPKIELSEIGSPILPRTWRDATTITVSYGYGISVSPLQLILGIGSIINDGRRLRATLLRRDMPLDNESDRVISSKTSKMMRDLMRRVITEGTGRVANVDGYSVIGKTGTVYVMNGRVYNKNSKRTTFIGAFPHEKPRYIMIVMMDDPKAIEGTHGYSTAGWNAARVGGDIITRMAPVLCVKPVDNENDSQFSDDIVAVKHVDTDFSTVD
jgi:cell division protein FtsI (penicillin-binding protein 3)